MKPAPTNSAKVSRRDATRRAPATRTQSENQFQSAYEQLRGTREQLRGTREQLRGTREQLRGTREQLRGTREQLQGTYAQLATSQSEAEALREAQDELEASRHGYARLYDSAPVAFFSLDCHGCIRALNAL